MEYISSASQDALSRRYRSTAVVTLSFALAIGITLFVFRLKGAEAADLNPGWRQAFYFSALALGVLAVVLRRYYLARAMARNTSAALERLAKASIIVCMIGEIVVIIGSIAYLLTGDWDYCWRFGAIGLLLVAYAFPRRGEWERTVAASEAVRRTMGSGNRSGI